ncbi:hypothetical protein ACFYZN_30970 [Streptomyces sp. NPDC001777]|uniref:hypothetical protein n=1 Tax=Streptomyces sp. NPDC001777 TaxID=3364608 RepID=UPI003693E80A
MQNPSRPGRKGAHPALIVGLVVAVLGLAWACGGGSDELAPGCRYVGKFKVCDDPVPSPSPSDPYGVHEPFDPYGDPFGTATP